MSKDLPMPADGASGDDRAVVLTPPGAAAIAVLRLRGPGVPAFLAAHFSRAAAIGGSVHGELRDANQLIDDAVIVQVDATTADLNLHGGAWVLHSAIDLARRSGFHVLDRTIGPLPALAVDATTQLEEEVLCHLPMARTEEGLRALLAQDGQWKQVRRNSLERPGSQAELLRQAIADRTLEHLLHPPTVAIMGPANAGKSTLANQLFAQDRSITADMPGTTRDWVGEIANVNGLPIMLLDTPGLRRTKDPIEQVAIQRSRAEIESAALVVLALDASRPWEGEQAELAAEFPAALRVLNKFDGPATWAADQKFGLPTIATTGQGLDRLRGAIVERFCGSEIVPTGRPLAWTARQHRIIKAAIESPRALDELWSAAGD